MEKNIQNRDQGKNQVNKPKGFYEMYFSLNNKFEFDKGNWKIGGLIFVGATLIFPYLITLIIYLAFQLPAERAEENTNNIKMVSQLLQVISVTIGFVVLTVLEKGYFLNGKGWLFLYTIVPILFAIILGVIFTALLGESDFASAIANVLIMIFSTGLVACLVLCLDRKFMANLKESFKRRILPLLVVGFVGMVILFLSRIVIVPIERLWAGDGGAANQNSIENFLKSDAKVSERLIYAIFIGIYTVILAPFIEEVIFRYTWNLNTSNRWLGFVTSSIYFGFMHYGSSGDFAHALSYTVSGFVFGGIFLFTKGNTLACWITHFLNNAISFAIILTGVTWW